MRILGIFVFVVLPVDCVTKVDDANYLHIIASYLTGDASIECVSGS